MSFKPELLSQEEIDAIYQQHLKQLEAMHLQALLNQRVLAKYGQGMWDPDTGPELISAVRLEASECHPKGWSEE